jgi:hypothetical protein
MLHLAWPRHSAEGEHGCSGRAVLNIIQQQLLLQLHLWLLQQLSIEHRLLHVCIHGHGWQGHPCWQGAHRLHERARQLVHNAKPLGLLLLL